VIADRLRQLEGCGLVELDASLIAVEYVITPFGATALDCLDHLRIWVEGLLEELQNGADRMIGDLPRLKPSPIPPINSVPEYLADERLRAVYEDTKSVLQVPWMGVVTMAFAHYPAFYAALWGGMRELAASADFVAACRTLRDTAEREVEVQREKLLIELTGADGCERALQVPWQKTAGKRRREILVPEGMPPQNARPIRSETRATLVASIARGRRWLKELTSDAAASAETIAEREGCSTRKVNQTISLAFLAPDLGPITSSRQNIAPLMSHRSASAICSSVSFCARLYPKLRRPRFPGCADTARGLFSRPR
jgi:hypothetical protein